MTTEQQTQFWHKYNSFRLAKVRQYTPVIYKALKAQLQHFADNRNIDLVPMEPIATAIKSLYVDSGRLWAHQSYLNVMSQAKQKSFTKLQTKARMPIGFNEDFVNSILQYFQLRLLNEAVIPITETTKDWIRQQLSNGILQGLSIDEIVDNMLQSAITKTRAERIARTEIMKAANLAADIGAEKTGLLLEDIWISVRDNRTRRDHRNADGQTVQHGQPFVIGDERYLMMRPGDGKSQDGRKVKASEICNCRCVKGHKVLRGEDGLPLGL